MPIVESVFPEFKFIQGRGVGKLPFIESPIFQKENLISVMTKHKAIIQEIIFKYGGILLRGTGISTTEAFENFAKILYPKTLNYTYRSTPRTQVRGHVFTTTEYTSTLEIRMHNENSYTNTWPDFLVFCCIQPSETGGETPLVDSRVLLQTINKEIVDIFQKNGVKYIRNFYSGIDLPWQEVFQTEQREQVNQFCKTHNIFYEWYTGTRQLTTYQTCPAVLEHPISKEKVWFNQAHLFHPEGLDKPIKTALLSSFHEDELPRTAKFGNDKTITPNYINHILDAYEREKIIFSWEVGDILILDNVLMAHGRLPFTGNRKVLVAMSSRK